ncbi:MAG: tellurite resistance TerB family protein [Candidatus Hydrogenedentes bacterium]|nr:tellurite resistance TerB family protein [Candidatus Hydrogenedentota bacterium]
MTDFNKILNQLLESGAASSFTGGLAGGLAGSMLAGKSGRKLGKKALKLGGMAAIAALAYTAYKKYSGGGASLPSSGSSPQPLLYAPEGSSFMPPPDNTSARADLSQTLVRAMIAAARADKKLDSEESQAIFGRIDSLDVSPEEKSALIEEMNHPVDMDDIVRASTSPEVAAEIYTASLLAIDVDHPAESSYLSMLAARLKMPRELVEELHRQVEGQQEAAF